MYLLVQGILTLGYEQVIWDDLWETFSDHENGIGITDIYIY